MSDYIDRKEALKHLTLLFDRSLNGCFAATANDIQKIPAVDVAPVVRGHWLMWEEKFPGRAAGKKLGVFCSVCENHADNPSSYCPHCGAKMEGDDG